MPNPFIDCPYRNKDNLSPLQASVLASQEKLQYVAAFGDKKEYIALIETQLRNARYVYYLIQHTDTSYHINMFFVKHIE